MKRIIGKLLNHWNVWIGLISLILLVYNSVIIYQNGILIDELPQIDTLYRNYFFLNWIALVAVYLGFFCCVLKYTKIQWKKVLMGLSIGFLLIGGTASFFMYKNQPNFAYATHDRLVVIEWKQVETLMETDSTSFIYVGRPTCPSCRAFQPDLVKALENNEQRIYYYNIQTEKEENPEALSGHMEKLGVTEIPVIVEVKKGTETQVYGALEFLTKFMNLE